MPLGTLDRTPPPFFKQDPSASTKLMVFSALALFLMVADARFKVTVPLRAAVATVLYPVQWLAMQPIRMAQGGGEYFQSLTRVQASEQAARKSLAEQGIRANQVEQLALENARLRKLLDLRERLPTPGHAAEVLYDAADPYTRKVVVDRGQTQGVQPGSPVLDEFGVLGQVTRVYPLVSEVSLLVDRDQAIPVLNTRTGVRSVAFGEPGFHGGGLELRFMAANADVQQGDLLVTSGVDGVYPPGLPVARVEHVERRAESAFARIHCVPLAQAASARHVMVLDPLGEKIPAAPAPETAPVPAKKGARK